MKIILATGRPTYGVAPIAEHLCLREYGGYILSYNGGRIINWQTGKVMYENLLERSVIPFYITMPRNMVYYNYIS